MKRIFVPTQNGGDWQRLLAKPSLHWKKGRSAMTAAACWEAAEDKLPPEISQSLDASNDRRLSGLSLILALPEWTVPLAGGITASQTDVLALTRNDLGLCVLAVEAKVDEDFGPTIGERMLQPTSGQSDRLQYLQKLLQLETLDGALRYQLLHRTASAVLVARELHAATAVLMVHSFGKKQSLVRDFQNFCTALRCESISPNLQKVTSFSSPHLFLGWCDGDKRFLAAELPPGPL